MKVVAGSVVFACYSTACAPPPAGKGGSVKGGSKSRKLPRDSGALADIRDGRKMRAQTMPNGRAKVSKSAARKSARGSWS